MWECSSDETMPSTHQVAYIYIVIPALLFDAEDLFQMLWYPWHAVLSRCKESCGRLKVFDV